MQSGIWNGLSLGAIEKGAAGRRAAEALEIPCEGWRAFRLERVVQGNLQKLTAEVRHGESVSEMMLTAPNFHGFRYAHPSQTVCLGFTTHHEDYRFDAQWFYTPAPLVLPLRIGSGWFGVALGAQPGKNVFSSMTYRFREEGCFELDIRYDGYYEEAGEVCTLFFGTREWENPYQVVAAYSELLRSLGWAPRPVRKPASWWKDTFLCTWGEQWNLAQQLEAHPHKQQIESHHVTSYETQANQTRWIKGLLAQGVPVGVVSTSDKWQLHRYRLLPDEGRYEDLRGFADWNHREGRKVVSWFGMWKHDGAPLDWCIRDKEGRPVAIDPEHPEYRKVLAEDIRRLLGPEGYDLDGFFLDFTGELSLGEGYTKAGNLWGMELLHDYVKLVYDAAKEAKPDAMIVTHCAHPYFADCTDVLRLNDFAFREPDVVEQGRYRAAIAAAVSDWLINTDNWFMYDIDQWREYLKVQPELGIPAAWHTQGIWGMGVRSYSAFTEEDYSMWKQVWTEYRRKCGL